MAQIISSPIIALATTMLVAKSGVFIAFSYHNFFFFNVPIIILSKCQDGLLPHLIEKKTRTNWEHFFHFKVESILDGDF